ncbi:hypothetical protein Adt_14711 [Abeliophyllum distichum]|uniref:Uncharacterized protein n=1 Tax=Abeliophyllum distichum TaxID=126358 RepID=A0ABD1U0F9_9LAMI
MGESTGDRPMVASSVEEVMSVLGIKPRSTSIWVLFFSVGAEFDGVRPGMGATRVTRGGSPMVKLGSGGFGVGSTIRNLILVSYFLVFLAFWFLVFWCFLHELIIWKYSILVEFQILIATREIEVQNYIHSRFNFGLASVGGGY